MGLFDDILKGLPVNAVLREKINDVEAKYSAIETENAILKDDNRKLIQQLAVQGRLQWESPYYWRIKDDSTKDGPFCQHCYDKDKELIRLQGNGSAYRRGYWICTVCKNDFKDGNYDPSDDVIRYRRDDRFRAF